MTKNGVNYDVVFDGNGRFVGLSLAEVDIPIKTFIGSSSDDVHAVSTYDKYTL